MKFVAFIFAVLLTLANAQDYSINWYTDNINAEEFQISTAADLRGLAVLVNDVTPTAFAGKTVNLANDIDLEGVNFTPIGNNSSNNAFKGTFDGNGHTIRRLSIDSDTTAGLFGYIIGGEIKNVKVEASKIKTSSSYVGGLVGSYISSKFIENCHVIADSIINSRNSSSTTSAALNNVDDYNTAYAGGLIGYMSMSDDKYYNVPVKILNSHSSANILSEGIKGSSGGLVGYYATTVYKTDITIDNSYATGNVVGAYSGGLIGLAYLYGDAAIYITNSYASGKISAVNPFIRKVYNGPYLGYYYSGGLVGYVNLDANRNRTINITNSYAMGDVSATTKNIPKYNVDTAYAYTGGLVGYAKIIKISDSYAGGNISALNTTKGYAYSGGLIGYADGTIDISNSYADGDISATYYSGGLIGFASNNSTSATIANSYFGGNILKHGNSASYKGGGIFGRYYYPSTTSPITSTSVYYKSEGASEAGWVCNSSNVCSSPVLGITGIFGKSSDDLKKQATFDGWDFTDVWGIVEDYTMPFLDIKFLSSSSSSEGETPSSSSSEDTPSSSSSEGETPRSSSSEDTPSSSSEDETPSSSSSEDTPSSSSDDETPSSSSESTSSSSSSEDTPSSSSGEETPIRLPQIASSNQATQIHNGINLQTIRNAVVEIYGLDGKLIGKQNFSGGVYNVSLGYLPKGLYIVNASFGGEKKVLKVPVR